MRFGKPRATTAEIPCGNRKTREANAARAKAQGKPQHPAPQPLRITRRIPVHCGRTRKGAHAGLVGL